MRILVCRCDFAYVLPDEFLFIQSYFRLCVCVCVCVEFLSYMYKDGKTLLFEKYASCCFSFVFVFWCLGVFFRGGGWCIFFFFFFLLFYIFVQMWACANHSMLFVYVVLVSAFGLWLLTYFFFFSVQSKPDDAHANKNKTQNIFPQKRKKKEKRKTTQSENRVTEEENLTLKNYLLCV